jgi:hypothetical protein
MATQQCSYVQCKNENCGKPILLPSPNQLDKFPDQLDSDNQYSEIYVCPACGHVYEYRRLNVRWAFPRTLGLTEPIPNNRAVLLEFDCGKETPSTRILIRKSVLEVPQAATLVAESDSWVLHDIHCPQGHLVTKLPSKDHRYVNWFSTSA